MSYYAINQCNLHCMKIIFSGAIVQSVPILPEKRVSCVQVTILPLKFVSVSISKMYLNR